MDWINDIAKRLADKTMTKEEALALKKEKEKASPRRQEMARKRAAGLADARAARKMKSDPGEGATVASFGKRGFGG